jgi:hypothetical protein
MPCLRPMENVFTPILQTAIESRERLRAELKRVEQIIALSTPPLNRLEFPHVTPGEYVGQRVVTALESYLRARRGLRIPLTRIVQDLMTGGVDPGSPRGRNNDPARLIAQTVKIALPNKRKTFQWEPDGLLKKVPEEKIVLWLAPTADELRRRSRYPKKLAAGGAEAKAG